MDIDDGGSSYSSRLRTAAAPLLLCRLPGGGVANDELIIMLPCIDELPIPLFSNALTADGRGGTEGAEVGGGVEVLDGVAEGGDEIDEIEGRGGSGGGVLRLDGGEESVGFVGVGVFAPLRFSLVVPSTIDATPLVA